jgi:hypothetical protein
MNGIIKRANGNELISFLTSAQSYLNAGKKKEAVNRLNTFIVKVQDMIKSRRIPETEGNSLVSRAKKIIDQINGVISVNMLSNPEAIQSSNPDIKTETKLGTIYPNPTSEAITINYEVASDELNPGKVMIQVFDVTGRLVGNLVNRTHEAGRYSVTWNGYYENGAPAPRGVYYVRFTAGSKKEVQQIMLIR